MLTCDLFGPLELVTAPTEYPVTLAEIRSHLRTDTEDDDDDLLAIIKAATEFCEREINGERQIMLATYDLPLAGFWSGVLPLPRPPLSSVSFVKYYNTSDTLTEITSTQYLVRTPWRQPGTIERAPGTTWSYTTYNDRRLPVVIRFIAGYASAAAVPHTIKQAVKIACGWMYENREPEAADLMAVERLLALNGYGAYA